MAYALELAFDIPPAWGYLICALVVIPLVTHGVTAISRLQAWTQPLWLLLLVLPYAFVLLQEPEVLRRTADITAVRSGAGGEFDLPLFGARAHRRHRPGHPDGRTGRLPALHARAHGGQPSSLVGGAAASAAPAGSSSACVKMLGGALLAYLAIATPCPSSSAVEPEPDVPRSAYEYVFPNPALGGGGDRPVRGHLAAQDQRHQCLCRLAGLVELLCPAHAQPSRPRRLGRVQHPDRADAHGTGCLPGAGAGAGPLLERRHRLDDGAWSPTSSINKPLGLSPPGIEFKRAHLYDINPVGVGAMGIASLLSVAAFIGLFGADGAGLLRPSSPWSPPSSPRR